MWKKPQKALRATEWPVVPVYDPGAGIFARGTLRRIVCRLIGHKDKPTVRNNFPEHDFHMMVEFACVRCGATNLECVECDFDWWV